MSALIAVRIPATDPLFCNKGMALAKPQVQQKECRALAAEGRWLGPYRLFTELFQSCGNRHNIVSDEEPFPR
jgi:hypothetical protein